MIAGFTEKDEEALSGLVLFHKQKVIDHTRAVPNRHLAKRHNEYAETLLKVQTHVSGGTHTCEGCVREGREDTACIACTRAPDSTDHFKRRVS